MRECDMHFQWHWQQLHGSAAGWWTSRGWDPLPVRECQRGPRFTQNVQMQRSRPLKPQYERIETLLFMQQSLERCSHAKTQPFLANRGPATLNFQAAAL